MRITDTKQVTVGEHDYWIHPFPAMTAANISGEVLKIAMPVLGAILPMASGMNITLDSDMGAMMGMFGKSFDSLSGDEIEKLARKLLIDKRNIVVDYNGQQTWLTEDILNEYMAGEIQDVYILAWEVIKVNFGDFFGKLTKGSQSGSAIKTPDRGMMN